MAMGSGDSPGRQRWRGGPPRSLLGKEELMLPNLGLAWREHIQAALGGETEGCNGGVTVVGRLGKRQYGDGE
ncbi:hypothetical protein E2562_026889 [Oryza meyeriana var. granulata]|uniref:Uncharacterized protein n=1 Tax=Oryza meyeriana var. granulata TaxID=110450 RepID=A0A6G1EPR1_9ORYZ|nr:hypothetical protein E2562_026889 [Oryza meyeriana var. granulata]